MWFQYPEKLNKDLFRIFILEPGEQKDEIQGSLQTHHLDAAPEYEALSYEWGKRSETRLMKCNNCDFKITQSLDIALRRLRLTDQPRALWIDQICINQESYDERSAQVSIMRLIYSNAAMVIAWLGPADTEATNSVKSILTSLSNLNNCIGDGYFPDNHRLAKLNLPPRESRGWNDLNLMLSASYFSRVWIIQELAVSSQSSWLWGDLAISQSEYQSMFARTRFLCMHEDDGTEGCPRVCWHSVVAALIGRIHDAKDLFELVYLASASKATVPHDKIYALIGLADQRHYNIEPDYSKSESGVFADFAMRVISTHENLDILEYAYVEDPNESKRSPLWAPRWQPEDHVAGFINRNFKASKDTKAMTKLSKDANVLELRGLEVGVVEDVHHRVPEVYQDVVAALKIVKNHSISFERMYKLDAIKVIILTMMAGREREDLWAGTLWLAEDEFYLGNFMTYLVIMMRTMLPTGFDTELVDLFQLISEVRGPVSEEDEPDSGYTSEEQSIFDQIRRRYPDNPEYIFSAYDRIMLLKSAGEVQDCRSFMKSFWIFQHLNFFITGKGHIGIGPRCMKAGDRVCVLFGGSTPYVIRPTSITDEYLYLGPAYVHGIMDGEVIDAWEKDKDSKNQEFQEKFFKLL